MEGVSLSLDRKIPQHSSCSVVNWGLMIRFVRWTMSCHSQQFTYDPLCFLRLFTLGSPSEISISCFVLLPLNYRPPENASVRLGGITSLHFWRWIACALFVLEPSFRDTLDAGLWHNSDVNVDWGFHWSRFWMLATERGYDHRAAAQTYEHRPLLGARIRWIAQSQRNLECRFALIGMVVQHLECSCWTASLPPCQTLQILTEREAEWPIWWWCYVEMWVLEDHGGVSMNQDVSAKERSQTVKLTVDQLLS